MMKKIWNCCWYSANTCGRRCTVQFFTGVKSSFIAWSKYAKTVQIFAGGKFSNQICKKMCKYLQVEQHLCKYAKNPWKSQLWLRNIQMHPHVQRCSQGTSDEKSKKLKKKISFADKFSVIPRLISMDLDNCSVSQHDNEDLGVVVNEDKDGVRISNPTIHIKIFIRKTFSHRWQVVQSQLKFHVLLSTNYFQTYTPQDPRTYSEMSIFHKIWHFFLFLSFL